MQRFAGILPFGYDTAGQVHVLLAREAFGRDAGLWSGFAGKPEAKDGGDPLATASREGFEESCGLLGTQSDLMVTILPKHASPVALSSGQHYLLPLQFNSYLPFMFKGVQSALVASRTGTDYSPFLEKTAIRWFSVQELSTRSEVLRPGFREDIPALLGAMTSLDHGGL